MNKEKETAPEVPVQEKPNDIECKTTIVALFNTSRFLITQIMNQLVEPNEALQAYEQEKSTDIKRCVKK